jgi:hypothetical protein
MCLDCGKKRWNTAHFCCTKKPRFAYIGPGYIGHWKWCAHERNMDFDDFLKKFGLEKVPLEVEGQMRLL